LRSPEAGGIGALVAKEWRELASSRALLFVAMAAGPLVAQAYGTSLDAYTEASGVPGGAAALTQALSPLDGFVSPVFGAYAVIATLLYPFVAIRAVAAEKESGAHALALQGGHHPITLVLVKFFVLLSAWVALWIPGIVALGLWSAAGGHLGMVETVGVLSGHFARGAFVAALGIACAAATESGASAAVLALAVTLGGWAVDFSASVRGGWVEALARYTPDAALRTFEHGDVQLGVIALSLVLTSTLLLLAVVWLEPARPRAMRWAIVGAVVVELVALAVPAASLRPTWDLSEDRRNSLATEDVALLRTITEPVRVTAYLGAEDPRRTDLEQNVFRKLRRAVPDFRVDYAARTSTGLFEGPSSKYGEVWYDVAGSRELNRSSAETTVLATIYGLAGRAVPDRAPATYPGYPLRARATTLQLIVVGLLWPLAILAGWVALRRGKQS
jgi:hypothetical protein